MHLLVVNAGSSTLRYALMESGSCRILTGRTIETGGQISDALDSMFVHLADYPAPEATGHRVVHGGPDLTGPALIDDAVLAEIGRAARYAPLHNPSNLEGIEASRRAWPDADHVVVFDTGFHRTIPERAATYALPVDLCRRNGLRRFGFHGISHEQLMLDAGAFLGRSAAELDLITLHLGGGASATAIKRGKSIDTSMGMTPTEGLVMGTRSGDLDPGLLTFLMREEGLETDEIEALINRKSGLRGLCGDSDMREVRARALAGDSDAVRAIDVYAYRLRKYVGAYLAVLGRIDALVFSGGVGEHHPWLIFDVLEGFDIPGLELPRSVPGSLEPPVNIAAEGSKVALLVLPADETRSIARQVLKLLDGKPEPVQAD